LLAIQLRTGINGLDAFSTRSESPGCLLLFAAVAEDDKLPDMSLSFAPGMLRHKMSWGTCGDISLIFHGYFGLQKNYDKLPNG
jgi:hypothetical protein